MNTEKINFKVSRDFGETFNVSVKFLRQNFRSFFGSIILIAGPLILIAAVSGAFYQSNALTMMSPKRILMNDVDPFAQFGLTYFLFIIASLLSHLALLGTTFAYMVAYQEKGPGNITTSDVSRILFRNTGRIIGGFFLYTLLIIIAVVIVVLIIAGLSAIAPALGVLMGILLFFGILVIAPPFMWQFSVFYLAAMQDDIGVTDAMSKTRSVMKDNFWWTWVIVVCAGIAIAIIGVVFAMPQFIYQMILMISNIKDGTGEISIPFIVVSSICTFFVQVIYSIYYIISGFHYYSLAEKKGGDGLLERIDEIGKVNQTDVNQTY
ncbi:MAG: hypothetical protein J0L87_13725 [Bacteroidetes bacterium]|nr:hypothetical protein [Bacteroidota bacterium]